MQESRPTFSSEELDRLLHDLGATGKSGPRTDGAEVDRALEEILGAGGGNAPAAEANVRPAQSTAGQPVKPEPEAAPAAISRAVRPVTEEKREAPALQPVVPAAQDTAAQTAAKRQAPAQPQAIPEQQRRPFVVEETPLKLDDGPLVTEDFRKFFTTSVTPNALFSSNSDTEETASHGHAALHSFLHRSKVQAIPVVETAPEEPEELEEIEEEEAPQPRRSFWQKVKSFFLAEDEEEEDDETYVAVPSSMTEVGKAEELTAAPAALAPDWKVPAPQETAPKDAAPIATGIFATPAAPAEEKETVDPAAAIFVPSGVQQEEKAPADAATTIFDAVAAPAEEKAPADAATTIFEKERRVSAAEELRPEEAERKPAGRGAEPTEEPAERAAYQEVTEDENYNDPGQRAEIAADLRATVVSLTLRAAILAVLCFTTVWFGLAAAFPALPQPAGLVEPKSAAVFTLAVYLGSLLIGGGVSWPVLKNGVPGLWQTPSEDSFAALSWFGALLQVVLLLVNAGGFDPAMQLVYAAPALLALLANALGKRLQIRTVQKNFERLSSARQQYAVAALVQDDALVRRLTHGLGETEPYLLVSRPAGYYSGFLRRSFELRPGERLAQRLCQALVGLSLLSALLAIIFENSLVDSFAGVLCLGCPLTLVLSSAVPVSLMDRSAEKNGTILPGPQALEDLGQTNVVVADAKDLFPAGSVLLKGLKVFDEPRVDLAILYAASLLVPNCPTLRNVFLDIIQERTEILPEISGLRREIGCGYEGWVESRHLLVGNRGMMIAHGVAVPPEDYELNYTKEGRYCPVYLAVNGRLYAMFVMGYRPDADVKEMLDEIYRSGLSLLVTSDDFNLTGERIDRIYGIPSGCIKVLGDAESRALAAHTSYVGSCEGAMAHATSFKGFIAGIRIAANGAAMEKTAGLLQMAAVLISAVLVLVLTCTGGLGTLGLPAVLLYQLAWMVLILMLPLAKQY